MKRFLLILFGLILGFASFGQNLVKLSENTYIDQGRAVFLGESKPLIEILREKGAINEADYKDIYREMEDEIEYHPPLRPGVGQPQYDALSKKQIDYYRQNASKAVNLVEFNDFDGVDNVDGVAPPDNQGDVNGWLYMECVNSHTAIYKEDGTVVSGPFPNSDFWSGTGYDDRNDGDAVILWDEVNRRWFVTQFYVPSSGTQYLLIAVSTTNNPLGSYYRYAIPYTYMPDYPKWGLGDNSFFVGANAFDQSNNYSYEGVYVTAINKSQLLSGTTPDYITYLKPNLWAVFPVDCDQQINQDSLEGYFMSDQVEYYWGNNQVYLYKFNVDWSNNTGEFFRKASFNVSSYNYFQSGTEVPQPGTTQKLDLLHYRTMYRSFMRIFNDHVSIVMSRTIKDSVSQIVAAVRWYEFRSTDNGNTWSLYQEGTFNPDDGIWRWMPSIAMNECGDISLGYSVSDGSSKYPSLRVVARYADDPLGVMTTNELEYFTGSASQTNVSRWGDYSMVSVDSSGDGSFWYVGEYTTGSWNWKTRIVHYKLPCVLPTTQASNLSTSSITGTSFTLSWTRGDGDSVIVLVKEGSAVDADPVANTYYVANATFGSGSEIGTGNYVVYKGTGTSVTVTGLNTCTDYYFAVYEFNTHCVDVCYLTPATTGSVTTACSPPSITSVSPDNFFADKGKTLTIDGTSLSGATVTLGGVTGNIVTNTDTQIVVDFPAGYYTNNTLTVSTSVGSDSTTVTVNKRNIIPVGGGTDYHTTIQSAIDGLKAWYGTTSFDAGQLPGKKIIEIYSGTYNEGVLISGLNPSATNNLEIRPAAGNTVEIDATGKTNGIYVNEVSYVTIKGLTIHGSDDALIYIKGNNAKAAGADTIILNRLYGSSAGAGVLLDTASDSYLQNNLIYDNYTFGVRIIASDNVKLINNTIADNGHESKAPPLPNVYDPAQVYVQSGTGVTLNSNILYSKAGTYYFTLKTETGVTVNSSYNTYYKNGNTYLLYYDGNLITDLSGWSDAGTGDIETDPQFVDEPNRDYHILSEAGSYHGGEWPPTTTNSGTWTNDASTSPALDAGDPSFAYDNEPQSGNRINQGAYGNTVQASKTPITDPPSIADVSPNYLYEDRGKRMTITGSNLTNSTFVLGGVSGTVVSNDGSTAVVDFPAANYVGSDLVVTNPAGSTTYTGVSVLQRNIIPVVAGSDVTSDNHPTIKSALDGLYAWYGNNAFNSFDLPGRKIIDVFAGTYNETVNPNTDLSPVSGANLLIRSHPGEIVTIDGNGLNNAVYVDLDYVTIQGFNITNAAVDNVYLKGDYDSLLYNRIYNAPAGSNIILDTANNCYLRNNLVYDGYNYGLRIIGSNDVEIISNTFADNAHESKAPPLPNGYDPAQIYIQSGTGTVLKNNIIYAKAGNYIFTMKTESGITVTSSYNTYFKNGNNYLLYYDGTIYSDLSGWPDAGTGDLESDPLFVDEPNDDYHILSEAGSYHGGEWPPLTANSGTWTNDASTSPALDAGDPADPYDNEPQSGNRINQGAYGNTVQASKSPVTAPPTVSDVNPTYLYEDRGKRITITGSDLSSCTFVLGGVTGSVVSNDGSTAVVDFPPADYTGSDLVVSNALGSVTYNGFSVLQRNIIPVVAGSDITSDNHPTITSALDGLYAWYGTNAFSAFDLPGRKIIDIYAGTYNETVNPNKNLNPVAGANLLIRSHPGELVTVDGTGLNNAVYVDLDYVTLEGLNIRNAAVDNVYLKGDYDSLKYNRIFNAPAGSNIILDTANNNYLANNLIYDGYDFGIRIIGSDNTQLVNNTIADNAHESKAPPLPNGYDPAQIYIQSGTGTFLKNNIIFSKAGNYIFTIKTESGVTFTSSYNTYYKNGNTYLLYYDGTVYNDLASWPDAGTGDLEDDPLFVDEPNDDYHILSIYGSYHGGEWPPTTTNSGTWTYDASTSPALDAGDPNDPYDNEPVSGNRINQGAYGNTAQASKSAGELVWDGSESTDWQTPANWTPEKVPTSTDIARIPDGCPNYPKIDESNDECYDLVIEPGGSVTTVAGGLLTVYNDASVDGLPAKPGTLTIDGGTLKVSGNLELRSYSVLNLYTLDLSVNNISFDPDSRTHYFNTLDVINWNYGDLFIDGTGTKTITGTFTTPTTCDSLTIESTAVLEIPDDGALTVNGYFLNNGDETNFIIRSSATSTGSLIHNNTGVAATCERYITGNKWHLIFAPLSAIPTSQLVDEGGNTNTNVYSYDETTADYWDATTIYGTMGWTPEYSSSTLRTDKGLLFNRYNYPDKTYSFTGGTLFAGDKSFTLSYTDVGSGPVNANGVTSDWDDFEGWNLLGNPYPSAIDWDNANISKSAIEDVVYYYDDQTAQYKYYGGGTAYNQGITVNGGSRYIPSGQGFFVKALATSNGVAFSIPNSARVHSDQAFWKAPSDPDNLLRLQVEKDDYFDETVIRTLDKDNLSLGHDPNLDALKLFAWDKSKPQLYSHDFENRHKEALNSIPEFDEETVVPLGVYIGYDGQYRIRLTKNTFRNVHVWLEDRLLNKNVYLAKGDYYEFNEIAGDHTGRFYLHLAVNHKPVLMYNLSDFTIKAGEQWAYTIPEDMFVDYDFGDYLTITATSADGSPLPDWLTFNGKQFRGLPEHEQVVFVKVTATDRLGESVSDEFMIYVYNEPANVEESENLVVYPNPGTGIVKVSVPQLNDDATLKILDENGKVVKTVVLTEKLTNVDVSDLGNGVYYFSVILNDRMLIRKFVKK